MLTKNFKVCTTNISRRTGDNKDRDRDSEVQPPSYTHTGEVRLLPHSAVLFFVVVVHVVIVHVAEVVIVVLVVIIVV